MIEMRERKEKERERENEREKQRKVKERERKEKMVVNEVLLGSVQDIHGQRHILFIRFPSSPLLFLSLSFLPSFWFSSSTSPSSSSC